jgi:hypothetical protein
MRLIKYEIRMYVTKHLHDLVSKEAERRNAKMSQIAREKLSECFLPKNESVNSLESANKYNINKGNKAFNSSFTQIEKKLFFAISEIKSLRSTTEDHLKFLTAMIDQFYLDVMQFYPEIPSEFSNVALSIAKLRHSQWLDKTKKSLYSGKKTR